MIFPPFLWGRLRCSMGEEMTVVIPLREENNGFRIAITDWMTSVLSR